MNKPKRKQRPKTPEQRELEDLRRRVEILEAFVEMLNARPQFPAYYPPPVYVPPPVTISPPMPWEMPPVIYGPIKPYSPYGGSITSDPFPPPMADITCRT